MNILIFNWRDIHNPKAGGAEFITMRHAKAWVKNGHQVIWFTSRFPQSQKEETIESVKIIRQGNFITVFVLAPLFYFFSNIKFDIVIDEIHGIPFFTPLYVRKPKIAFIHEVAGEIWNYSIPFPLNFIGSFIETNALQFYKKIPFWTDANSTIDDLVKYGIKRKNCIAISCPISNKALKKSPIKEKNPTFIFVGRVVKMKGIENVIRAFFYILKEINKANLWIVGDGDKRYVKDLKEIISAYSITSKVRFFGRVSETKKLELIKKAHILLHASIKEGWGLVVIEAASQATPSVVYDVAGLRDSVKNGITGIVLVQNTPFQMAKQAVELYNNRKKYKIFQKNSLDWASSLTWDKAEKQSLELIRNVLKKE